MNKLKVIQMKYRGAVDKGHKSGFGRVVFLSFFCVCVGGGLQQRQPSRPG